MMKSHQTPTAPWTWPLHGATLLPASSDGRWLVVTAGNVWLTRSEGEVGLSDDVWLAAGQRHRLPAGSEWVVEAWPEAQLELLLAPPLPAGLTEAVSAAGESRRAWRQGLLRALRHSWQRIRPAPRRTSSFA
jgi:Protein of unknown function (DUF2917)